MIGFYEEGGAATADPTTLSVIAGALGAVDLEEGAEETQPTITPMFKLNKVVLERYKLALRGKLKDRRYRQAFMRLREDLDCFCAVGILCDLQAPKAWEMQDQMLFGGKAVRGWLFVWGDVKARGLPPAAFIESLGGTQFMLKQIQTQNDEGKSLEEIADWVDQAVEGV